MTPDHVTKQLSNARWMRNVLFVLLGASVLSQAAMSVHMARQTNQVVLTPSIIADGMVARGAVNVPYLEALAKDVVISLYQVTPTTLGEGRAVIERVSAGDVRAALLESFDATAKDIEERRLSTVWRTEKFATDLSSMSVDVSGEFSTYVGTNFASKQNRTIRVSFGREGASARVIGIETVEN